MQKFLIALIVVVPFALALDRFGRVSASFGLAFRHGRNSWLLVDDHHTDHPCHLLSFCECWVEELTSRLLVNCTYRGLTHPPKMFKDLDIYELDLSNNKLEQTPNMNDEGYRSVRILHLNNNRIKDLTIDSISRPLEVLKLRNNQISYIDEAVLERIDVKSSLVNLDLSENPLACDCDAAPLASFLRSTSISEMRRLTCANTDHRIYRLTTSQLCPYTQRNTLSEGLYAFENPHTTPISTPYWIPLRGMSRHNQCKCGNRN